MVQRVQINVAQQRTQNRALRCPRSRSAIPSNALSSNMRWPSPASSKPPPTACPMDAGGVMRKRRVNNQQTRRIESEYERNGALKYLAAWDVRRGIVVGRCEKKTGIKPLGYRRRMTSRRGRQSGFSCGFTRTEQPNTATVCVEVCSTGHLGLAITRVAAFFSSVHCAVKRTG